MTSNLNQAHLYYRGLYAKYQERYKEYKSLSDEELEEAVEQKQFNSVLEVLKAMEELSSLIDDLDVLIRAAKSLEEPQLERILEIANEYGVKVSVQRASI